MTGGQILSDDTLGINLQGRKYGKNYTTIVAWDDVNYAYVGLKTENGRVVACPLSEAEDFYFAVVNPVDDQDQLSTVETVDGTQFGITMKMVDFNNPKEDNRDSVQDAFFGKIRPEQFTRGLLSTQLIGDYPETTQLTGTVQSLGNLFTGMQDVNHLFIQSIYNESGYFEYDSTSNFAHLNEDGTFTVFGELCTYNYKLDGADLKFVSSWEPAAVITLSKESDVSSVVDDVKYLPEGEAFAEAVDEVCVQMGADSDFFLNYLPDSEEPALLAEFLRFANENPNVQTIEVRGEQMTVGGAADEVAMFINGLL